MFLEEAVEAMRAADFAIRVEANFPGETRMGSEWAGGDVSVVARSDDASPAVQALLQKPPPLAAPSTPLPTGQLASVTVRAAESVSVTDLVFASRVNALHPPITSPKHLERAPFYNLQSTCPPLRMPWFGASEHVEGLRFWLAQRAAGPTKLPFPVRVVVTVAPASEQDERPVSLRTVSITTTTTPTQRIRDLRHLCSLLQAYHIRFWSGIFPVNKVAPREADNESLLAPEPEQVAQVIKWMSTDAAKHA